MKTRTEIILIVMVLIVGLIVIPSSISVISPMYCDSIQPTECVTYSISLIPNFRSFVYVVIDEEEGQRQYDATPATCNDITGKPDGQCFIKSFEKCKHASIKNIQHTQEGDTVFVYAYIDVDDCKIHHSVDLRLDRFSSRDDQIFQTMVCTDLKLENTQLFFQCGDGDSMMSLR